MDVNNTIGATISIFIVVVLMGSLLIPILDDVTTTSGTFDNEDFARHEMAELQSGDEWTRTDGVWYYNGEELTSNTSGSAGVIFTDNLTIREIGNIRGVGYKTAANSTNSVDVVAVDESTLGLSINDSTTYVTFTYGFGAVLDGDYIMKDYGKTAYVLEDTDMYITGVTAIDSSDNATEVLCVIAGSIGDGFTVNVSNVKNSTVEDITVGTVTVNATPVDGYVDLYLFDSIEFTISGTQDDTEVSTDATYSTFVMPKVVTAELSEHLGTAEIGLIMVIPILLILAVVVITARGISRD